MQILSGVEKLFFRVGRRRGYVTKGNPTLGEVHRGFG